MNRINAKLDKHSNIALRSQLNAKIEEAKRKKNLLIAKQKRAEAQRRIHDTMAGLSDKSAFRAFDQMAEKIESAERQALASAEVTEELTGDTLVSEFRELEAGGDAAVEDKLLALKASMGLLPEPEEPKALESGEGDEIPEAEIVDAADDGAAKAQADGAEERRSNNGGGKEHRHLNQLHCRHSLSPCHSHNMALRSSPTGTRHSQFAGAA